MKETKEMTNFPPTEVKNVTVIMRGEKEPEIEFQFSNWYEKPGDTYDDPPYLVEEKNLKHKLSLSVVVEDLLMDFMEEEDRKAYEDMFLTKPFDEKIILSWINKYYEKASIAYYNEDRTDFLLDAYCEAHEHDWEDRYNI